MAASSDSRLQGPLGFQERVLAGHQPLAGKGRGSNLGQVLLIEQGQLQRAAADQRFDLRGAQRGDPVQVRGADVLAQPRGGQHAAVADEHHAGEAEPVLDLAHLGGDGLGVAGVSVEHLDGDRDAVLGGEQPVDDLQPSPDPVLGVPDGARRAGPPLERGGGHVVEDQGSPGQVPGRQRVLDPVLPGGQPVHRAYRSSSSQPATPSTWPSELAAVRACRPATIKLVNLHLPARAA